MRSQEDALDTDKFQKWFISATLDCMSFSSKEKLWGKRLLLLVVVSLLVMGITGQMDFNYPFQTCDTGTGLKKRVCDITDTGQVLMLVLLVIAGILIWHFADERKK